MRSLWIGKTYIKNSFSPLNWNLCWEGWNLSKMLLWVSVGQLAAKLQAVKIGGLKKILPPAHLEQHECSPPGFDSRTIGSSSNFDSLYLCSQLTHRDPQYLFRKISTFSVDIISKKETGSIFQTDFALSKWPNLHRAYPVISQYSSSETVVSGILFWECTYLFQEVETHYNISLKNLRMQ